MNKRFCFLLALALACGFAFAQDQPIRLENEHLRLEWTKAPEGWKISNVQVLIDKKWLTIPHPSGEYTLLFSETKPPTEPDQVFKTITGVTWPDPAYTYQISVWKESTSPVSLNTAGTAFHFYPSSAKMIAKNTIEFVSDTKVGTVTTQWSFDETFAHDIKVSQTLTCKAGGYYSLASPTLTKINEKDISWATVPGYFQGKDINQNMILAYAYGQGIPSMPVVYRERCASTFSPIISTKNNVSVAVIPEPGTGRDPWTTDKNTHQDWYLGISHMNRKAELSPTMYYPVLGEPNSSFKIR